MLLWVLVIAAALVVGIGGGYVLRGGTESQGNVCAAYTLATNNIVTTSDALVKADDDFLAAPDGSKAESDALDRENALVVPLRQQVAAAKLVQEACTGTK
jgi:hypothetical protein